MTYQQFGKIQATDYNNYVGTPTDTAANKLNTIFAGGNGRAGIGQAAIAQVVGNDPSYKVTAQQWNALINAIAACAGHQGSTITPVTINAAGDLVTAVTTGVSAASAFEANLNTIYTNLNNCAAQSASAPTVTTRASSWNNALTFTHTISFANADAVRYFFNAGGQIALTFSHPTGTNVNALWSSLAAACGTVVISGINTGSVNIAGTVYNGVTKIGGTGTPTVAANLGYHGRSTANQEIFKQLASSGPAGYTASFISVNIKTNGTQGASGDSGTVITLTTLWDEIPNGGGTALGTTSSGSTVTCTIRTPGTSYITNTWGTVAVVGSVTGT